MPVTIKSKMEADYLLIKASGLIADAKEWKELPRRYYEKFVQYNVNKIVIDAMKLQYPLGLLNQCILVDTCTAELPIEIRKLKLAVVVDKEQKETVDFWETYGYNRGYEFYRAFYSMEEARKFMDD